MNQPLFIKIDETTSLNVSHIVAVQDLDGVLTFSMTSGTGYECSPTETKRLRCELLPGFILNGGEPTTATTDPQ